MHRAEAFRWVGMGLVPATAPVLVGEAGVVPVSLLHCRQLFLFLWGGGASVALLRVADGGVESEACTAFLSAAPGAEELLLTWGLLSVTADPGGQRQSVSAPGLQQPRPHWSEAHAALPEAGPRRGAGPQ